MREAFDCAALIKRSREVAGLSQEALALRMNGQQPLIGRIEAGHVVPSVVTLQRIANALGRRLEIFFVKEEL